MRFLKNTSFALVTKGLDWMKHPKRMDQTTSTLCASALQVTIQQSLRQSGNAHSFLNHKSSQTAKNREMVDAQDRINIQKAESAQKKTLLLSIAVF